MNQLSENIYDARLFDNHEDAEAFAIKANAIKGDNGVFISNGWPEGVEVVGITVIYMEDVD